MFNILANLHSIRGNQPKILFLRHGEKQKEHCARCSHNVSLTKKGYQDCVNTGAIISKYMEVCQIKSSPITRCVETAFAIAKGFNKSVPPKIKSSNLLGDPGAYVVDPHKAMPLFVEESNIYKIMQDHYNYGTLPGMRNITDGTQLLLKEIREDLENCDGPIVYISHDIIIATFIASLFDLILNCQNQLDFLNGICISMNKDNQLEFICDNVILEGSLQ